MVARRVPSRGMSDYERARSGIWVGVVMSAFAVLGFGTLAGLSAIDCLVRLVSTGGVQWTALLMMCVGGLLAAVFSAVGWSSYQTATSWARCVSAGAPRRDGLLVAVERTGARINHRHLHVFRVRLDGVSEPLELRWFYPSEVRAAFGPGARVVVLLDPRDPTRGIVDWDAVRATLGKPCRILG